MKHHLRAATWARAQRQREPVRAAPDRAMQAWADGYGHGVADAARQPWWRRLRLWRWYMETVLPQMIGGER